MSQLGSSLPEDVRAMLRDRVHSVEQLQTLLLLFVGRDRSWTVASVARSFHVSAEAAAENLEQLCRMNLLDVRVGRDTLIFRYSPGDPRLDETVCLLAEAYRECRMEVIALLGAKRAP